MSRLNTFVLAAVVAAVFGATDARAETAPANPAPVAAEQRQLVKLEDTRLAVVYSVPGLDLKSYSSVLVKPINVEYQRGNANMYRFSKSDLKKLNDYALEAFNRRLSADGRYKVVTQPGPGTLVVQAKLKDVWLAFSKNAGGAGRSYTMGEYAIQMTLEAELIDAETGEVLVIAADRKGDRINPSVRRVTSLDAWQQVQKAFDFWAGSLRQALDDARK
jgi:hypothetical protein